MLEIWAPSFPNAFSLTVATLATTTDGGRTLWIYTEAFSRCVKV